MIKNNEAGYTLLLTLALIVIITGFIGSLSYLTLNQQSQVEKTDEKFLLSDITEMGIEFYRNQALQDYIQTAIKVKDEVQDKITNSPGDYDTEAKIRALELSEERIGLLELKDTISKYEPGIIPVEDPIHFTLSTSPVEVASSNPSFFRYKFNVMGSNTKNSEEYSFILKFPNKFLNVTISPGNPGDGSGSVDYSKTIPTPNFTPPTPTEKCNGTYKNKTCISEDKTIRNINNSTVYYQGDTDTNNANHIDFNNSVLIIDGNLDAKNLRGVENISILVNGDTSIDHFFPTNVRLYSSGTLSLNKDVTITDSNIRSLGPLIATKKGITLSESHMVLEGRGNSIDPFDVTNNSTVCIKDDSSIDQLYIDSTSFVYILNSANRTGSDSKNSKKSPVQVDHKVFNEKCYGVSDSEQGIGIDIESNLTITPESILDEVDYDTLN